jgi:hypothetical protein
MRGIPVVVACAITVGLAPVNTGAQQEIFRECQPGRLWQQDPHAFPDPWSGLHPRATFERARAEVAAARWDRAAGEVAASFHGLADAANLSPDRRDLMVAQLDAMTRDLLDRAGSRTGLRNAGRFGVTVTPRGAEFTFGTGDIVLAVTPDEPVETIRAVCWTAAAGGALLDGANRVARDAVLQGLERAVAAWDAFNTTGYAQYPWELWLNRPPDGLMPPRVQWILMHPNVGLELVGTGNLASARRVDTILIEPLGVLRYTDGRRFYLGASLLASLSSNESIGLGPMLHLGQYGKLGYVFRSAADSDERGRDGLVMTADVLQFVTSAPEMYQRARDRLAARLGAAVGTPLDES